MDMDYLVYKTKNNLYYKISFYLNIINIDNYKN